MITILCRREIQTNVFQEVVFYNNSHILSTLLFNILNPVNVIRSSTLFPRGIDTCGKRIALCLTCYVDLNSIKMIDFGLYHYICTGYCTRKLGE